MPSITGSWDTLSQATFEMVHPNGGYLHFRENSPAHAAVRQHITSLAATHGWPLTGIWISGYGECPHFALHISEFPTQIGANREEKLQNEIDAMLAGIYEDVDLGRDEPGTFLRVKNHVWRYDQQGAYVPRRSGVGDFALSPVFDPRAGYPPANWWVAL